VSAKPACWGIYRELAHSPGRETDDAEILRAVARELALRGFAVDLKSPDELPETPDARGVPPYLFVMCERIPIVERLAAWERLGARVVNRPEGIRNTYRERTIERFARHDVPFPPSVLVPTAAAADSGPVRTPCWVKRGDVHATELGDVAFAADAPAVGASLARLSQRGIARAVLQEHVTGDLVKFYGVGGLEEGEPLSWFQWFYHRDQALSHCPLDPAALSAAAAGAASALGLEVFGGDAIATADGRIVLIDLNAWPSFALYRATAAASIAALLEVRFLQKTGVFR
jgi:hypothetical protein